MSWLMQQQRSSCCDFQEVESVPLAARVTQCGGPSSLRRGLHARIEDDILSLSQIKAVRLFPSSLFGQRRRRPLLNEGGVMPPSVRAHNKVLKTLRVRKHSCLQSFCLNTRDGKVNPYQAPVPPPARSSPCDFVPASSSLSVNEEAECRVMKPWLRYNNVSLLQSVCAAPLSCRHVRRGPSYTSRWHFPASQTESGCV